MSRRKLEDRNTRKLAKGRSSYFVTIPVEIIRELGWKKTQKLVVSIDRRKRGLTVRDWKK